MNYFPGTLIYKTCAPGSIKSIGHSAVVSGFSNATFGIIDEFVEAKEYAFFYPWNTFYNNVENENDNIKKKILSSGKPFYCISTPTFKANRFNYLANEYSFNIRKNHFLNTLSDTTPSNCPQNRYELMLSFAGLKLEPWKSSGDWIGILLQLPKDPRLLATDCIEWVEKAVAEIKKYSDRDIRLLLDPTWTFERQYHLGLNRLEYIINDDPKVVLQKDLNCEGCHAIVTASSYLGPYFILEGIPTIPVSEFSDVYPLYKPRDIRYIDEPHEEPDRIQWLSNISYMNWFFNEIKDQKHLEILSRK